MSERRGSDRDLARAAHEKTENSPSPSPPQKKIPPNNKRKKRQEQHQQLTDGDVVVLGEHPPVKVRAHVVADVHLGEVGVVRHLVVRDADALLERDRVVVLSRVDLLGDAGVGAVGADDLNCGG